MAERPSFANIVKNSKEFKVERPNCLNFKHRNVSKRNEAIEFIKSLQFSKSKLLGVAEMPGKSIDVTCKSRDDVLELYKKIQAVSDIIKVKLYETDNIHVVVGWVPIPISNERIKKAFENIFGPVLKIMQRKCKDGLISGVRILIMEKRVLESNPIPSYVHIDGNQLYVTYDGQNFTCKYCGNVGHKQIDCNKRAKDFPIFIRNQDSTVRNPNFSSRQYDDSSAVKRQKVVQLSNTNEIGDKKSNTSKEISSEITEKMNDEPINLTKPFQFNDSEPNNLTLLPEPESHEPMETAPAIEKNATRNNWWENELSVLCCNCSAENILTPNENGFTCWNCCEKCIVARPCCCREENPETYFTVSAVSTKTICLLCKTNMNYLTCCKEFVAVSVKNDIINCMKCNKIFIECQC